MGKRLLPLTHKAFLFMEVWKEIKGFEDYEVSNLGRVKSLKFNKVRILKGGLISTGYYCVVLQCNGKKVTKTIHQLVAELFLDHEPNGHKLVVDHIDNNKLNNRVENLQIVTNRFNCSKDTKLKYTGVYLVGNKYQSIISVDGKQYNLGFFKSKKEAIIYYKNAVFSIEKNEKIKVKRAVFSSKHKYVYWNKKNKKWVAVCKKNHLGYFKTEEEAIKVVDNYLNFCL